MSFAYALGTHFKLIDGVRGVSTVLYHNRSVATNKLMHMDYAAAHDPGVLTGENMNHYVLEAHIGKLHPMFGGPWTAAVLYWIGYDSTPTAL